MLLSLYETAEKKVFSLKKNFFLYVSFFCNVLFAEKGTLEQKFMFLRMRERRASLSVGEFF